MKARCQLVLSFVLFPFIATTMSNYSPTHPPNEPSARLLLQVLEHLLGAARASVPAAFLQVQLRHHPVVHQGGETGEAQAAKAGRVHGQAHHLGEAAIAVGLWAGRGGKRRQEEGMGGE